MQHTVCYQTLFVLSSKNKMSWDKSYCMLQQVYRIVAQQNRRLLLLGIVQSSSNVLIMYLLPSSVMVSSLWLWKGHLWIGFYELTSGIEVLLLDWRDLADLTIQISTIMALICSIKWWFWKSNRPLASNKTGLWNPMKNYSVTYGKFNRDAVKECIERGSITLFQRKVLHKFGIFCIQLSYTSVSIFSRILRS